MSDVGTVYNSTKENMKQSDTFFKNAHPQQNVSILLEKSQNTFIPRTYRLKGETVEYPASVVYDTCSGKLVIRTTNALANITRRLIGQRQKFATVYSAIYCWKPDVMSNVAYDWST